jgi:hypothetical protein
MTILFITAVVLAIAFIFYQIGHNHGEDKGYIDAMNDVLDGLGEDK